MEEHRLEGDEAAEYVGLSTPHPMAEQRRPVGIAAVIQRETEDSWMQKEPSLMGKVGKWCLEGGD